MTDPAQYDPLSWSILAFLCVFSLVAGNRGSTRAGRYRRDRALWRRRMRRHALSAATVPPPAAAAPGAGASGPAPSPSASRRALRAVRRLALAAWRLPAVVRLRARAAAHLRGGPARVSDEVGRTGHARIDRVRLPLPEGQLRIDHVVFAHNVVFVLTTLDLSGLVRPGPSGAWRVGIPPMERVIPDPLMVCRGRAASLAACLPEGVRVEPLVVMTGFALMPSGVPAGVVSVADLADAFRAHAGRVRGDAGIRARRALMEAMARRVPASVPPAADAGDPSLRDGPLAG